MLKKPTAAQLHRKLTPIFNRWVRLRDTTYAPFGDERRGWCISCGTWKDFGELQAGHFVPANHYVHRYNPKNVNVQCISCNKWRHGNPFGYALGLREKYGSRTVWFLLRTMNDKAEYTVEQLQGMIEYYSHKVKELEG